MALTVDAAIAAGDIAAAIKARYAKIEQVKTAMSDGWVVSQFIAANPVDGSDAGLLLDRLDKDTSAQAFGFALQIYQGQIKALEEQLAAL